MCVYAACVLSDLTSDHNCSRNRTFIQAEAAVRTLHLPLQARTEPGLAASNSQGMVLDSGPSVRSKYPCAHCNKHLNCLTIQHGL
jgi:hypothetical protein